jgi:microsomal prostaglandin-E synthase 2
MLQRKSITSSLHSFLSPTINPGQSPPSPPQNSVVGEATTAAAPQTKRPRPGLAIGLTLSGIAAMVYAFTPPPNSHQQEQQHDTPASSSSSQSPSPDTSNPYSLPTKTTGLPKEIILYQYDVCPFCCKVKTFLDYHNLPYTCIEVNPLTKGELKWSKYKKVPVVVIDGEQVNDSSAIISRLAAEIEADSGGGSNKKKKSAAAAAWKSLISSAAAKKENSAEEEKWRRWVDDHLVKVITTNIYRNAKESFQTFNYITENGNFNIVTRQAARVVGATTMWAIAGRLKKKYGVEGDVREALYEAADTWVEALGSDRVFMGGEEPNLADLAVFGVVRSVVGTDTFNDVMHNSEIGKWYEQMMKQVGESSRVG